MSDERDLRNTLIGTWCSETTWGLFRREHGNTNWRTVLKYPGPQISNAFDDSSDEITYLLADSARYERSEDPQKLTGKLIKEVFVRTLKGTWRLVDSSSGRPTLILECKDIGVPILSVGHSLLMKPAVRMGQRVTQPIVSRILPPDSYETPISVERYEVTRVDDDNLEMTLAGYGITVAWSRAKGPRLS
ncbi:hypothetical protein [Streptomyces naphthomycinicus]|uniref:hypothetical protein n=1 Tax=Streptomyces naphthomycinicus TaxID=2872625 RepID=UPI001CEDB8B6|nr:hypothetical protein [Streptomyces sp. TML10]